MRRRVWAWPVGIVGNVLLFTVFLGGVFHTPQARDLYGQAGRQVFFIIVSVYGWVRWSQARARGRAHGDPDAPRRGPALGRPLRLDPARHGRRWSAPSPSPRIFRALGSWGPWADAWIFTGSFLATYGMARGWIEFWLIWIAVDAVGVPLLFSAGYYPSAVLYVVYAGVVVWGFVVWWRQQARARPADGDQGLPQQPLLLAE